MTGVSPIYLQYSIRSSLVLGLGIPCPTRALKSGEEWWFVAQSLNLRRRNNSPETIYAIHKLLQKKYPALATPVEQAKAEAKERQKKGGKKAGRGRPNRLVSHDAKLSPAPKASAIVGGLMAYPRRRLSGSRSWLARPPRRSRMSPMAKPRPPRFCGR